MSESFSEPNMTVEEYLAREARSASRHEYVQGRVFAMSGATQAHNVICGNLFAKLHAHLDGGPCRAYISDMKVKIEVADCFYYPDVMVTCEPFDPKSVHIIRPALIVEVLSPSTMHIDRREKLVAYQQIDSLQEYVIVHQGKALVEVNKRQPDRRWVVKLLRQKDTMTLNCIPDKPFSIPVGAIYEGLDLSMLVEESAEEYSYS